ncbi:MAG: hypothetical protein LQ337_004856 [Flavoplaca oasis]|nr:MAG: hypothetical protein LQ337_004856 [Flavoplaca oasis]
MQILCSFAQAHPIALFRSRTGIIDESNEIYEPYPSSLSQRQQRQQQPISFANYPRRPLSSSSGSTRTLRRTPNFEQQGRRNQRPLVAHLGDPPPYPGQQQSANNPEEEGGESTIPRDIRAVSRESAFWPQRTNRISRRTAAAIIYALEDALRRPYSFTPITAEEYASMADITSGAPSASNGRAQNGGSRNAGGAMPVPHNPSERVRTPTDIMRERRDREARKKAASERQKEQEIAAQRRKQTEEAAAAGDAPGDARTRERPYRSSRGSTGARDSGGENVPPDEGGRRQSKNNGGAATTLTPLTQPQVNTISGTTQSAQPSSALRERVQGTSDVPQPAGSRRRTQSQGQAAPTQAPAPAPASGTRVVSQPQPRVRQTSTAAATNASQARPSAAGTATKLQNAQSSAPGSGSQQRTTTTSSFPHAFERWETLSSHWEGLTSFWIRRLQQNSDEIDKNPLNSQLARQVNDLSAAGANLFHAVVELQRLRASSERKFQRWYFENEAFKEEAKEIRAGLEEELRQERTAKAVAVAALTRVETDKNSAYQNRSTAEQMVKEMKRELQISKEEARRAWEELGRREQEERDRTSSLRSGQPTLVGGVQVVPLTQGGQSGQASTNRPSTREDPEGRYMPPPSARSGAESVESPIQGDLGYTTYDPARSDTDTDPFTEGGRVRTGQTTIPSIPMTIPQPQPTSNASAAALQAAQSAAQQAASSNSGGTYLRYGPSGPTAQGGQPSASFYQHEGSSLLHESHPQQQSSSGLREFDDRSYVPSVPDTNSQEEYEMNSNGEIQRDDFGNPIPYRGGPSGGVSDLGSEDTDEYDVQDQLDRERIHGQRYGSSGIPGVEYGSGSTSTIVGGGGAGQGPQAMVDYSGSGYGTASGWEAVPRHHHPTRLSDVLEEDERTNRTSPSRASQR